MTKRIPSNRTCSRCQRSKTTLNEGKYEKWHKNGNGGFYCNSCYAAVAYQKLQERKNLPFYEYVLVKEIQQKK